MRHGIGKIVFDLQDGWANPGKDMVVTRNVVVQSINSIFVGYAAIVLAEGSTYPLDCLKSSPFYHAYIHLNFV